MKFDFSTPLTLGEVITILIGAAPVLATIVTVIVKKFRKVFYAEPIIELNHCDSPYMYVKVNLHNITSNTILITDAVIVKKFLGVFLSKHVVWRDYNMVKEPINVIGNDHVKLTTEMSLTFENQLSTQNTKYDNLWIPYLCVTDSFKRKRYFKLAPNLEYLKRIDKCLFNRYFMSQKEQETNANTSDDCNVPNSVKK